MRINSLKGTLLQKKNKNKNKNGVIDYSLATVILSSIKGWHFTVNNL